MTRAEPHAQAIRDAVADVMESNGLIGLARSARLGEADRSVTMQAAMLAVERVLGRVGE